MDRNEVLVAIVDDEESIRKALLRLFRLSSYRAEAFSSASDFLDSLSEQIPDCVILDLQMPGMTGVDLLRQIQHWKRPLPIIVITAHDAQSTHDECRLLGIRHYLRKPIDGKVLLEHVRNAVGIP